MAADFALTRKLLIDLYVHQGLSSTEIARRVGGSDRRILNALKRFGIDRRPGGSRGTGGRQPLTAEALQRLYVDERRSLEQVGQALGGYGIHRVEPRSRTSPHPASLTKALQHCPSPRTGSTHR